MGGVGLSIPAVWQVVTGERTLKLQRAQHEANQEERETGRRQARYRMEALADQTYQRAARTLREMPASTTGSWFDWAELFAVVLGQELRNLFLDLRVAAAMAGDESAETGKQLHSDFMQLEETVRLISTPNRDPRSPDTLVREAVSLRTTIRVGLQNLGASVDWSGDF